MTDPSHSSTAEIIAELRNRGLADPDGLMSRELFDLRLQLAPAICVDGIAYRFAGAKIELLAIRRGTGPYTGKLCMIGGLVRLGEPLNEAVARHFRTDLGVDIEIVGNVKQPLFVEQYARDGANGFLSEPTKPHVVDLIYPVRLLSEDFVFGKTAHGGQEAIAVEWLTAESFPDPAEFGYDHHIPFRAFLDFFGSDAVGKRK